MLAITEGPWSFSPWETSYPVDKSDPSWSWECTGRQESVDIWFYQCYHPSYRSPWHLRIGSNPQTIIFPPPNLTVFWVNSWGLSTILAALGMELNWWFIWKSNFLLSNLPSGCGPWRTQHGFLAVSCLVLVSGQQYDRGDHCEQESDVQFLTKQASLASTPPGAMRRTSMLSSRAVVFRSLSDLGLSWTFATLLGALANPLHLPFRHIEDVCNFSRRLGLEILDDQHFCFWFDLGHVDRSNVKH